MNANLNLYDPHSLFCTAYVHTENPDEESLYLDETTIRPLRLGATEIHRTLDHEHHDTIHPTENIDGARIRTVVVDWHRNLGYIAIAHQGQWAIIGKLPRNNKIKI